MNTYNLYEIARSLDLWNEYYNTSALMTDADFHAMSLRDRMAELVKAYGGEEGRNELAANDRDGVYPCENGNREVLTDMDFYDALETATDTIYGNVCDSVAALIEAEYGIR